MFGRIVMGKDSKHGDNESCQMAAGIAEKCFRFRKIEWQKSAKRSRKHESQSGNQIVTSYGRRYSEEQRGDGGYSCAQSIHIIHEIESVHHSEYPENRRYVAENNARNKQRDANPRC